MQPEDVVIYRILDNSSERGRSVAGVQVQDMVAPWEADAVDGFSGRRVFVPTQVTGLKLQIKKPTPFGMGLFIWGAWR
jgi:hypothetical protein